MAIVVNPKSKIVINDSFSDCEGRTVICNMSIEDKEITLCNLYTPNQDCPEFFERIFANLQKVAKDHVIIGGDFNLVLNTDLDRHNSKYNNVHAANYVNAFIDSFNVTDIWRDRNQNDRNYSWFRKSVNGWCASRLDFFLTSLGIASMVTDIHMVAGCKTDHSLVEMTVENNEFKRGPGIWRMNNKHLLKEEFCQGIIECINNTHQSMYGSDLSASERWTTIKSECACFARDYSKNCSTKKRELLCNLYELQTVLVNEEMNYGNTSTSHNNVTLQEIEHKINQLEKENVESAKFRSKCTWKRLGEKNMSYYFSLEKHNYNDKTMFAILLDGKICKNQTKILREQCHFYRELYTANESIEFNIQNSTGIGLNASQKEFLDSDLSLDELYNAAKDMKINKVCGCGGLPSEFYLKFWESLKDDLWAMYIHSFQEGHFGYSTRKGVISLLPKKVKTRD